MCLFTKYIVNPSYKPNKKNGGIVPMMKDPRMRYIPAKCGKCIECRKQKQREWLVRLSEELKNNKQCYFITLTFNEENLNKFSGSENEIATKALRMFLERVRKKTGKSIRHWFVTELGEEKGRIHLHGIWWGSPGLLEKWQYGYIYVGDYVSEKTIFYITKYMLKENEYNRKFRSKVLCSAGLGKGYLNRIDAKRNAFKGKETNESYRLKNGIKINLPQYYRKKIYTDEERNKLWAYKLDEGTRYIMGEKISTKRKDAEAYRNLLEYYQNLEKRLYKTDIKFDKELHEKRKDEVNRIEKLSTE